MILQSCYGCLVFDVASGLPLCCASLLLQISSYQIPVILAQARMTGCFNLRFSSDITLLRNMSLH